MDVFTAAGPIRQASEARVFFSGIVRLKSIQKTSEKARTQNSLPPKNKNGFSQ